jgi:hypothetical protein
MNKLMFAILLSSTTPTALNEAPALDKQSDVSKQVIFETVRPKKPGTGHTVGF